MSRMDEPRDTGAPETGRADLRFAAVGPAGRGRREPQADESVLTPAGDRMREALKVAAVQAEETGGLGRPGRPVNKRSPFFIGMTAAAGVVVTYGLAELVIRARSVLVLIGLALFIAIGLDPVVAWLTRRWMPRWAAVVTILVAGAGIVAQAGRMRVDAHRQPWRRSWFQSVSPWPLARASTRASTNSRSDRRLR